MVVLQSAVITGVISHMIVGLVVGRNCYFKVIHYKEDCGLSSAVDVNFKSLSISSSRKVITNDQSLGGN